MNYGPSKRDSGRDTTLDLLGELSTKPDEPSHRGFSMRLRQPSLAVKQGAILLANISCCEDNIHIKSKHGLLQANF